MKHTFTKLGKGLSFTVLLLLMLSNIAKAQVINESFEEAGWATTLATNNSNSVVGATVPGTNVSWTYSAVQISTNGGTTISNAKTGKGALVQSTSSSFICTPYFSGGITSVTLAVYPTSSTTKFLVGVATAQTTASGQLTSSYSTTAVGSSVSGLWSMSMYSAGVNMVSGQWNTITFTTNIAASKSAYIKFQRDASGAVAIDDIAVTGATLTPPTLSASSSQSVDSDFGITFTDDATWRGAVTGITVDGTAYTSSSYTLSAGSLSLSHTAITELHTAGSHTIVVLATGYSNTSVTQSNIAGADNNLQITTQPAAPASNGGLLATQPVVKFRDQYNNITASTSNVVATVGSGTWTIGGTTTKAGVSGVATFTDLTATSAASVAGATITFTSGSLSVTSNGFNIPAPVGATPPTLVAAVGATVDNDFTITFSPDDATWRTNITAVSVGANALPTAAYDATVPGQLTLKPSQSAFLHTAGTFSVTVSSTGYSDDVLGSQAIGAGADNKLVVTTQPTAPSSNGGTLAQQPVVKVEDQYGNVTGSSASVVAAVTSPQTWTIGGTTTKAASSGTATFTDLTAGTSNGALLSGATITFTSGSLTSAVSTPGFTIPAYATSSNDQFKSNAATGNWSAAGSWLSSPAADGVNFYPATAAPTSAATSVTIVNGNTITFDASAAGTTAPTTIQNGGELDVASAKVLTLGGAMNVDNGGTLKLTGSTSAVLITTGQVLTVLGTLSNGNTKNDAITSSGSTLLFANGSGAGTYTLTGSGAQIPTATWVNGSNYSTLNYNSSANANSSMATNSTYGDFVINTGSGTKPIYNSGSTTSYTMKDLTISSAINQLTTNGTSATTNLTVRNFSETGSLNLTAYSTTVNLNVSGSFTINSGTLSQSSGTANIKFNGSSNQTATNNGTISGAIGFTVNNSAGVSLGSNFSIPTGSVLTFTSGKLSIGANTLTLVGTVSGMSAANSLTGGASSVLSVTGTGSLGSLFFDQTTPGTTNNLSSFTINRTSSGALTLSNTVAVANALTITAGTVTLTSTGNTAGSLTIGSAGTDDGTWGSSSSTATYQNSAFVSTGIVTVSTNTALTPTVTPTVGTYNYNGSPQGPNAATNTGTGTSYSFSYVGVSGTTYGPSSTQPTNPGSYTVTATVAASADGFYKQNSSSATAFTINGAAQATADFRSNGSGNFSDASNWQYDAGGGTWTTATQAPTNTNNVTVQNGNDIVLDADYTVGSGKTLTLNATSSLTINPTVTLTIAGTTDFNNQHVIVKSDATGTGSIGQITGTLSNASNATIERYIQANGGTRAWRLLSVPTQGNQTINAAWQEGQTGGANNGSGYGTIITAANNLSTWAAEGFDYQQQDASMLTYNMAANTWNNVTTTNGNTAGNNPANGKLATTSGYFLYVRGDRSEAPAPIATGTTIAILRSTGALYQGNVTTNNIPAGQFALIGNVYASPVDFTGLTKSNIDGVFYVWDPKIHLGSSLGAYQTFSSTTATPWTPLIPLGSYTAGVPNTLVQTGQAFFVHSTAGSGSVTLTESSKLNNYNDVFRPQTPAGSSSQLTTNLYEGSAAELSDVAVSVFSSSYADAVDQDDAIKLSNTGSNMGISRGGKILAIEGRQAISSTDTIFYNMWNLKPQAYKFSFVPSGLNTGLTAYLQDSYLGTSTAVDLANGSSVPFTVDNNAASSRADRFRLVFSNSSPVPVTFSSVQAYQQSTAIDVKWGVSVQTGVSAYVVERSTDGVNFSQVAVVSATNTGAAASYIYADNAPAPGVNYYRIRSIGISGDSRYTGIVKVDMGSMKAGIAVYPNPVINNHLGLQLQNLQAGKYGLKVITAAGQEVYKSQVVHAGGSATQVLTLPAGLAGGMYRLEVVSPQGSRYTEKLIIK